MHGMSWANCDTCRIHAILYALDTERTFTDVSLWLYDQARVIRASCNHCSHATCVEACPTGASQYWNDSNIVVVDATKCTGCKACIAACPYDARLIIQPQGYIGKCTFCVQRVPYGMDPACVAVCPAHAMHFGLLDDPTSNVSRLLAERDSYTLHPETGNHPNVFYLR